MKHATTLLKRGMLFLLLTVAAHTVQSQTFNQIPINSLGDGAAVNFVNDLGNGTASFFANDGTHGKQLWKSDGTTAGTFMLQAPVPFQAGITHANYHNSRYAVLGNEIYFATTQNPNIYLFRSRGNVLELLETKTGTPYENFTVVGNTLYFRDGTGAIYKIDASMSAPVLVRQLTNSSGGNTTNYVQGLVNINGTLFFSGNSSEFGRELYKSDGTAAGTVMVKNINQGNADAAPSLLTNVNGTLYFMANDGSNQWWKSDGTEAGTIKVTNLTSGFTSAVSNVFVDKENNVLYFVHASTIWKLDASSMGVSVPFFDKTGQSFTKLSGTIYFSSTGTTSGRALYKITGTGNPELLRDNIAGIEGFFTEVNGTIYFAARLVPGGATIPTLWKTDGTGPGTVEVKTTAPIPRTPAVNNIAYFIAGDDGLLYFLDRATSASTQAELWKSDGTDANTVKVVVNGSTVPNVNQVFKIGANLLATVKTAAAGLELFVASLKPVPVITLADITKTYGDELFELAATSSNPAVPVTYSIADGDNPDNVISLDGNNITFLKAGEAWVTASQAGDAQFDPATDIRVKITVDKAVLTVNAEDLIKAINQAVPELAYTFAGFKNNDNVSVVSGAPELSTTAEQSSAPGDYPITVDGLGTLAADNYSFAIGTGANLKVIETGTTPQVITFAELPAKTYGAADFDLTAVTDATGLSVSYSSSNPAVATITNGRIKITGAGTAVITASQAGSPVYAPAADVARTLTVSPAPLTITAEYKEKDRGQANPPLTIAYTGFVNNETAVDLVIQPALTTAATAASLPGEYPITFSTEASSPNYAITHIAGTLKVRGTQFISWTPFSTAIYGDAPLALSATSDAGTIPVYATDNPSVARIENGQLLVTGAGTAVITAVFPARDNFEETSRTQTITVQKKALSVSADDKSRTYGAPNPAFTVNYNGFVNNDTYLNLTQQPQAATTATETSSVGTYPITVSGAASDNYQISYVPGTLAITATERTLTFNTIGTKRYGDADFNPGASASSGETVTYTSSNTSVATVVNGQVHIAGAGTATITATLPVNAGYTGTRTATQELVVEKANLKVIADNKTKTLNGQVILTASFQGFVNGDNETKLTTYPQLTTAATTNSSTGAYPITVSGAASPNYEITYQPGILTIVIGAGQDEVIAVQAVSPNGDGLNDFFKVQGIERFPDNHVAIINRNGQKVWEINGYDNAVKAFTGKSSLDGGILQQGTYFYQIAYKVDGQEKRKSGYLVLKY